MRITPVERNVDDDAENKHVLKIHPTRARKLTASVNGGALPRTESSKLLYFGRRPWATDSRKEVERQSSKFIENY